MNKKDRGPKQLFLNSFIRIESHSGRSLYFPVTMRLIPFFRLIFALFRVPQTEWPPWTDSDGLLNPDLMVDLFTEAGIRIFFDHGEEGRLVIV